MVFICYRKADLAIVATSVECTVEDYSPQWEIENNAIPNFGGTVEDYDYIELTSEQDESRRKCGGSLSLVDGVVTFIPGSPTNPSPVLDPIMEMQNTLNAVGQELAQEKLKNTEKESVIQTLGQELANVKLELLELKGGE